MNTKKILLPAVITGLIAGLLVKLFCFDVLYVSGLSMYPSLKNGEAVFVNRLSYGLVIPFSGRFFFQWKTPQKDDVVIFFHDNKQVVKRVQAAGGVHLDFSVDTEYNLLLGGKKIKLTEEQYLAMSQFKEVPEGFVLVLGDNLSESVDSRDYGFVSVKNITGKIIGK